DAPRVLIANSNLVPHWATLDHFNELDRKGLMMYGQMTAGSWIYIGSQGIVQGTYETFAELGRRHYGGSLTRKWVLTAGLGGMGGAQPLAASHALLGCMGRDHGVAGRIEQDALQGSVVLGPRRDVMGSLRSQSPLHGLKQLAVDQWRLRARADLTF